MSAAAMELEALFSNAPTRPVERAEPTVVVRRKRLVAVEDSAAAKAEAMTPATHGLVAERSVRTFVRPQTEQQPEVAASAEVVADVTELAPAEPAGVVSGTEARARKSRRRRPDFMKPGEVIVIRPAPVEAVTEGDVPADTGRTGGVATVDAGQDERDGAGEESSPYVFDLEINTRWAAIDKALAALRASLLKPPARRRADTRLKNPRTAR